MGGCFSSARTESDRIPVIFYCPQVLEHGPFPSAHSNMISSGILVDTNLNTSSPDTYRAPPPPMPYDNKPRSLTPLNSHMLGETVEALAIEADIHGDLEQSNGKGKTESTEISEIEYGSLKEPMDSMEEDDCPICLEEYDVENPRIITHCEHHFHLSCILEWMERSDVCPICDQAFSVVIFFLVAGVSYSKQQTLE